MVSDDNRAALGEGSEALAFASAKTAPTEAALLPHYPVPTGRPRARIIVVVSLVRVTATRCSRPKECPKYGSQA